MLNHAFGIYAFANQHVWTTSSSTRWPNTNLSVRFCIAERNPSVSPLSYARRDAAATGHAENVRIKAVGVNHVDLVFFDITDEAAELFHEIQIVEARQRIFMNLTDAKLFGLLPERSAILKTGQPHAHFTTMQLSQQLQRLALAATLLKLSITKRTNLESGIQDYLTVPSAHTARHAETGTSQLTTRHSQHNNGAVRKRLHANIFGNQAIAPHIYPSDWAKERDTPASRPEPCSKQRYQKNGTSNATLC
jgi:hypothetical protein